jgi:hypothetical protein
MVSCICLILKSIFIVYSNGEYIICAWWREPTVPFRTLPFRNGGGGAPCSEDEMVSPIAGSILSQIRGKVAFSRGKHVSFANMGEFFDVLTTQIKKLV